MRLQSDRNPMFRFQLPCGQRVHGFSSSRRDGLVAVPLVIGYMQWERQLGIPREIVGAASMFFCGVGVLVFAVVNHRRLCYLGTAIPLMAFGLAIPLCTASQVVIAAGLCMMVGGLAMAGIQYWQLRSNGKDHGSN